MLYCEYHSGVFSTEDEEAMFVLVILNRGLLLLLLRSLTIALSWRLHTWGVSK